jgi:lysophospholipase L1-like esterase
MRVLLKSFCWIIFPLWAVNAAAQYLPTRQESLSQYRFVHTTENNILTPTALDSFFKKLYILYTTHKGKVRIVHIGDSHLQAGYISEVMRTGLQQYFGNAGRGVVFPYRQARSNAPPGLTSSSNINWQYNRVVHPESSLQSGVAGFVIQSSTPNAMLQISLRNDSFTKLRVFASPALWSVHTDADLFPFMLIPDAMADSAYQDVLLSTPANSFSISSPQGTLKQFYGVSLEKNDPGIIYHSIGVNGAEYWQYNNSPVFWQQLGALQGDLYILSLGTNEAQKAITDDFGGHVDSLVQRIRQISPAAAILITTPADSYLRKKNFNRNMQQVHEGLYKYCFDKGYALWDLYKLTGGYSSARNWMKAKLLSPDRVHYTSAGYGLQGKLLLNALSKAYNDFLDRSGILNRR